ncbi:MAG: protein kinase, partial [Acidobacteriota bacterium]|nr:protein kinase [Acidobacteriota bacterium]
MPDLTTITAGTRILHYRIIRAIGSGGMGVVYEAEDTRLDRHVALKFLPPGLAADAAALERFKREARAASALNHPNICTIYAIEDANGARFIAMELLEGESLDRRIANQPLSWDALVSSGTQIADALAAAHARGIVHRDIKPANIFLTKDGRAKVLDFGIAKIAPQGAAQAETVDATSAQQALTNAGATVGTIAYMSPEQARGDELDARTDIFSLGAVLYEMSTGRRAFEGKTTAVVFNNILESSPPAPRELNPSLPPKLEDVILRALEKDPELRYHSAADLRGDLKRLKRDATAGRLAFIPPAPASASTPRSSGAVIVAEARRHKGLAGTLAVTLLVGTAAAAYGAYSWLNPGTSLSATPTPQQLARTVPARLTTSGDVRGCGSISPDGKYVVYCDFAGELKLRQVATGAVVVLGKYIGDTTFSPDSDHVYVSMKSAAEPAGVLVKIPALGGDAERIATRLDGTVGVSPDGQRIAFVRLDHAKREATIVSVSVRGGDERTIATSSLESTWFDAVGMSWSPDGKSLSAAQSTIVGGYRMRPVIVDVASGKVTTLGSRTWPNVGRSVWLPGSTAILFAAREHLAGTYQFYIAGLVDGEVSQITNDTRGFGNQSVSVTADGTTLATVQTETVGNLWSTNADATAPLEQWTSGARFDGGSGVAPMPGGRLLYGSNDGSETSIWSVDGPGGRPRR